MTAIFISLAVGILTFCFGMLGHYLHRLLPVAGARDWNPGRLGVRPGA
ncbi:MAG: hypothetical protein WBA40_20120 [Roseiarcus sp.]